MGCVIIVRLSHYQQRAVQHRVPELHRQAMIDHRRAVNRTMHDVELPPIAWRQILDMMREQCFGPAGGKLDRGVPKSAYSAIKRIADAVMRIENHPAFHERAVDGWVGDVLVGWDHPGEMQHRTFSAYPGGGRKPTWLTPQHLDIHGREVTTWNPWGEYGLMAVWSLRPETHEEFLVWAQPSPSI